MDPVVGFKLQYRRQNKYKKNQEVPFKITFWSKFIATNNTVSMIEYGFLINFNKFF